MQLVLVNKAIEKHDIPEKQVTYFNFKTILKIKKICLHKRDYSTNIQVLVHLQEYLSKKY